MGIPQEPLPQNSNPPNPAKTTPALPALLFGAGRHWFYSNYFVVPVRQVKERARASDALFEAEPEPFAFF